MSYNSEKRKALDPALPLSYRASHGRSCIHHVAKTKVVTYCSLIELLEKLSGVNMKNIQSNAELDQALNCLDSLRSST